MQFGNIYSLVIAGDLNAPSTQAKADLIEKILLMQKGSSIEYEAT